MPNAIDDLGPADDLDELDAIDASRDDIEGIEIDGVDQQKAAAAWAKLEQASSVDQMLTSSRHAFYCIRDFDEDVDGPHFSIGIYPANGNPSTQDSLADIVLVRDGSGIYRVTQQGIDPEASVTFTAREANALLVNITTSVRDVEERAEEKSTAAEDVICQTREMAATIPTL